MHDELPEILKPLLTFAGQMFGVTLFPAHRREGFPLGFAQGESPISKICQLEEEAYGRGGGGSSSPEDDAE